MDDQLASGRARSVVGVVSDSSAAESLLGKLAELGVGAENITVMTREGVDDATGVDLRSSIVSGGAATGAAFGGLMGGLAGWMISIGALAIPGVLVPGVGLVFGVGTLASLLAGISVGAAAGGLIGALLGLGVPEEEAKQYERSVTSGRTLVTVHLAQGIEDQAVVAAFEQSGAYDVHMYETPAAPSANATGTVPVRHGSQESQSMDLPRHEVTDMGPIEEYTPVGDASAHTDAPGSGAEGGSGAGIPVGEQPHVDQPVEEYAADMGKTNDEAEVVTKEDERPDDN